MGEGFSEVAPSFLFLVVLFGILPNLGQSRDFLESIDEKMHTHAADGPINGIRGWY